MKRTRTLRRIAALTLIFAMLFGNVIDYSYANALSSQSIEEAAPEEITPLETEPQDLNVALTDMTEEVAQNEEAEEVIEDTILEDPSGTEVDGTISYGPFNGPVLRAAQQRASAAPEWVQNLIKPDGTLDPDLAGPGSVKAYAPIFEEDPNIANKWTVKMLVAARDSVKTSRIVLVIDTSGSMGDEGRIAAARNAAKAFVNNVLDGSQNTQIGIVRFASDVSVVSDFSNNKTALNTDIDALSAVGGTFTQAAVRQAKTMLSTSGADKKYMVVLSDGEPTYGYKINRANNYLSYQYINKANYPGHGASLYNVNGNRMATTAEVPEYEFGYDTPAVGGGSSMFYCYEDNYGSSNDKFYNFGNSAVAEARFAKDNNIRLFSIGLQTNTSGSNILRQMASSTGDFTEVSSVSQLTPVFEQIAAQILKTVNEATVNVNFNTGFELVEGFDPNEAEHSSGSLVSVEDGKPKWEMATVSTVFDTADPTLKYEYITYTVTVNDDILKNEKPENGINPLGNISMSYTDQNGQHQTGTFPATEVSPKLFVLHKIVTDNAGGAAVDSDKREFQFKVEKVTATGHDEHETIPLRPGESKIIHNPDKNAEYRVYELNKAKVYDENNLNPLEFEVKTYYNRFEVTANDTLPYTVGDTVPGDGIGKSITGSIPSGTDGKRVDITFTNYEETEARATISIKKKLENKIDGLGDKTFTINLLRKKGVVQGQEAEHNWDQKVEVAAAQSENTVTIPHKMRFTTYIVTEKDLESVSPYAPKTGEQGKEVQITLYKVTEGGPNGQTIEFTNEGKVDAKTSVTATKKWVNGPETDHQAGSITIELYRTVAGATSGTLVENVNPVVEDKGNGTFTYTWNDLPMVDTTSGNKLITYSVKEKGVTPDNKVTVNGHTYNVSQQENEITNTYEIPKTVIKATKVWSGTIEGEAARPEIYFQLKRKIGNEQAENVGSPVKLNGTEVNFGQQDETDAAGNKYTYSVQEVDVSGADFTPANYSKAENELTVTNTVTKTNATIKINKIFDNIVKRSSRRVVRTAAPAPLEFKVKITDPYGQTQELTLKAGGEAVAYTAVYKGKYTIEELDAANYTVSFTGATPLAGAANKAEFEVTDNTEKTITVTNKATSDSLQKEITVTKAWTGGDAVRPDSVNVTLTGKAEGAKNVEEKLILKKADDYKVTVIVPTHATNGNGYAYTIKEDGETNGKATLNGHEWTVTYDQDNFKVTNEYVVPITGKFTAKKVWSGNEAVTRPTMTFTLWRKVGTTDEAVLGAEVKEVTGTKTDAEWEGLETTNAAGEAYTFYVKEAFKEQAVGNDNWTLGSFDASTKSITNTVKSGDENLGKLTVKKNLLAKGQAVRALAAGTMNRAGAVTPIKFKFKVVGPYGYENTFELAPGESKELTGLYFGEYTVTETDTKGYTPSYAPDQNVTLKAAAKTATVEVTNTSGGEGTITEVTATKTWVNGPETDHTGINLTLKRKSAKEGSTEETVQVTPVITPASGNAATFNYKWSNLAKHDAEGYGYTYTVEEPNVNEGKVVINGNTYAVTQEGNTITNKYTQPMTDKDIVGTKIWVINEDASYGTIEKPEVKFELWRKKGTAGEGEKVVDATALTNDEANFGKQQATDINGVAYEYFVKEVYAKPDDILLQNWNKSEAGLNVENTLNPKPTAKLHIKMLPIKNGEGVTEVSVEATGEQVEFPVEVKGPYGFNKTFSLAPGESKDLENLLFGVYTVTETNSFGYKVTYTVKVGGSKANRMPIRGMMSFRRAERAGDENVVTFTASNSEATVEILNENGAAGTVTSETVTKIWDGGKKPDTLIELVALGKKEDGSSDEVAVGEFKATAEITSKTFENLPVHDSMGRKITYEAREPKVPANYNATVNGLTVTNVYKIPMTGEIKATKVWAGGPKEHPAIWFKLYRQIEGGAPVAVPDVELAELKDGTLEATWSRLEATDFDGNAYTFTVKEVNANGEELKLDHYKTSYSEDGLTVTNTYFENPSFKFEKTTKEASYTEVGDKITYVFTFENTGDVEIKNVKLSDAPLGITDEVVAESLKPGEKKSVEKVYVVTADDVKAGKIVNAASVSGTTPGGNPYTVATHTIYAKKAPNTGDENSTTAYAIAGMLAAAAFVALSLKKKLA